MTTTADVVIITPPDFLLNETFSILFVAPSLGLKEQMQGVLEGVERPVNVYLYDNNNDVDTLEWLITATNLADIVIVDVDNCDEPTRNFTTYLLGKSNTFYLTTDTITPYNLINKNKIYDLFWLLDNLKD